MSNRFVFSIATVLFLASGLPALAHHAFANEFDESKPITLEGVVTREVEKAGPRRVSKSAVDRAIDQLHAGTGTARDTFVRTADKLREKL